MIKKILYLITAINIFSLTEYEKEILKKNRKYKLQLWCWEWKSNKNKRKGFCRTYKWKRRILWRIKFNDEIFKYGNELYQYINPEGNIIVFEKKNDKFERIGGVILRVPKSYKLRRDRKSEDFFKYNKLEIKEEEIE